MRPGSAAAAGGIEVGDAVLELDGVTLAASLPQLVAEGRRLGEEVTLAISRQARAVSEEQARAEEREAAASVGAHEPSVGQRVVAVARRPSDAQPPSDVPPASGDEPPKRRSSALPVKPPVALTGWLSVKPPDARSASRADRTGTCSPSFAFAPCARA